MFLDYIASNIFIEFRLKNHEIFIHFNKPPSTKTLILVYIQCKTDST